MRKEKKIELIILKYTKPFPIGGSGELELLFRNTTKIKSLTKWEITMLHNHVLKVDTNGRNAFYHIYKNNNKKNIRSLTPPNSFTSKGALTSIQENVPLNK